MAEEPGFGYIAMSSNMGLGCLLGMAEEPGMVAEEPGMVSLQPFKVAKEPGEEVGC